MAKSIQGTRDKSDVRRLGDDDAQKLVDSGAFRYIGKMEWRRLVAPPKQKAAAE